MATAEPKAGGTYIYAIARGPRPARFSTLAVGNPEAPIRSLDEPVAAALRRKRGEDAPALLDSLVPLAVEHVVEEEPHEWAVLAASFLIDRTTAARFDDAVAELADRQQQRMRLRYVAPLPPY